MSRSDFERPWEPRLDRVPLEPGEATRLVAAVDAAAKPFGFTSNTHQSVRAAPTPQELAHPDAPWTPEGQYLHLIGSWLRGTDPEYVDGLAVWGNGLLSCTCWTGERLEVLARPVEIAGPLLEQFLLEVDERNRHRIADA